MGNWKIPSKRRANYFRQSFCFAARAVASLFVFALLDDKKRMIDNFDAAPQPRETKRVGPDAMTAANRYRQNRHPGFQSHAHGARFELLHRTIRIAAATFRENDDRAAFAQPLYRTADRRRIASFQLQRPRAKHTQQRSNYWPAKSRIPSQKPDGTSDRIRIPKRIEVGLMIRGDNETAAQRNIFQVVATHAPE